MNMEHLYDEICEKYDMVRKRYNELLNEEKCNNEQLSEIANILSNLECIKNSIRHILEV